MRRSIPFLAAVLVVACSPPPPPRPVTAEALRSATYPGIYEQPVTLVDGRYEGAPFEPGSASRPTLRWVEELAAFGDLDGDGIDDAAALLVDSSGGSGSFVYLAAALARAGGSVDVRTVELGDRVQVTALAVAAGEIVVDLVTAGPEEPSVAPSRKMRSRYRLKGDALVAAGSEETGRLSTADLEGPIWLLLELGAGRPVAGGVSITARFAEGRVTGSSGCNNYFAAFGSSAPGYLQVGSIGGTRRACPDPAMTEEGEFLARFERTVGYTLGFGRLRLDYVRDDKLDTMVFEPHDDPSR